MAPLVQAQSPLLVLTQSLSLSKSTDFVFYPPGGASVTAYTYGIQGFSFSYSSRHHVQQFQLGIAQSNPSGNTISILAPTCVLSDASGHMIDLAESSVTATVIAWTGDTTDIAFSTALGATVAGSNSNSQPPFSVPNKAAFHVAGMVGFDLAFQSGDAELENVNAQVSGGVSGTQGYFTSAASMQGKGKAAYQPTTNGTLIAAAVDTTQEFGFVVPTTAKTGTVSGQNADVSPFYMPQAVDQAAALLAGFTMNFPSYKSSNNILTIGAGPSSVAVDSQDNTKVNVTGLQAFMNDNKGNSQDNATSSATILLIGTCPVSS